MMLHFLSKYLKVLFSFASKFVSRNLKDIKVPQADASNMPAKMAEE
jgi:hypothetical protein